jgi:polar amino acid transport system substrate-binding protein
MKKITVVISLVFMVAIVLTACGGNASTSKDLLANIKSQGYVIVANDPTGAPIATLINQGKRPSITKCPSGTLTTAEMEGFDVDVAAEIGKRLGVETCFTNPEWVLIPAGYWVDKWDVSVCSMTITNTRAQVLTFTVPYYYDFAVVAVRKDSGISTLADLSGKALCASSPTVYEDWINGKLDLPAADVIAQPPANLKDVPMSGDQACAQAISSGPTDFVGYVSANHWVDANIATGTPVVKLGNPVFRDEMAAAVDKHSSLPTDSFIAKLNKIIAAMHKDGTLTNLSMKWFKADLTQTPK